jgi:peptide-methionine (S)-S-oxide reductase
MERRGALLALDAAGHWGKPIVTELQMLSNYARAEEYHQNYFAKNPSQGYCLAVAAPKVAKFRKTFARLAKP